MEILLFFILAYAAKRGWDDAWAAWEKSRRSYMASAGRRYPGVMSRRRRAGLALRHDAGYGLSQLLHGFPRARHGFAQGWNQGRQAHDQARADREKAKAERLETRAGLIPDLRDYRRRQREAAEEIRRLERGEGTEGSQGTPPCPTCGGTMERDGDVLICRDCQDMIVSRREHDDPAAHEYCPYCGARDDGQCPPSCASWTLHGTPYPGREGGPSYSYGYAGSAAGWPSATAEHAHAQAKRMSGDGDPWVVTEYPPGGGPGQTIATYRNGEVVPPATGGTPGSGIASETLLRCMAHPDHACTWVQYEDGTGEHVTGPEQAVPGEGIPSEEGSNPMSDVTYDGVVRAMATAVSNAETRAAEVNAATVTAEEQAQDTADAKTRASQTSDAMQALNMDPATLGAMADHLEALDEAEKAHQHVQEALEAARKAAVRVMETAQNVSATLQRGHQGLAQAHQDAPVEAADRPFYQG